MSAMQQHFADPEPSHRTSDEPAGPQPVHVARRAKSYAVAVDTTGKLRWSSPEIECDHRIYVVSERVPMDYLATLRKIGISYVVIGKRV